MGLCCYATGSEHKEIRQTAFDGIPDQVKGASAIWCS